MMPVVLFGCLYSGITTPTEAAALAAFYALLVSAFLYRAVTWAASTNRCDQRAHHDIDRHSDRRRDGVQHVITVGKHSKTLAVMMQGYELSPFTFLLLANVIMLDSRLLPRGNHDSADHRSGSPPHANALGIDPVHFGVVAVVNIMIGLVPRLTACCCHDGQDRGSVLKDLVREVMPFLGAMIVALTLITYIPSLVLFLPRLMGYQG